MAENVLSIEIRDTGQPRGSSPKSSQTATSTAAPPAPMPAFLDIIRELKSGRTSAAGIELDAAKLPAAPRTAVEDIRRQKELPEEERRTSAAGIELDADKLTASEPKFTLDDLANKISKAAPPVKIGEFELDASKGPKFVMDQIEDSAKPFVDAAAGIELNADKLRTAVEDINQARWLKTFDGIVDKLAKNLLTVNEAQDRIGKLVAGRKDEITDTMRAEGRAKPGDDIVKTLTEEAVGRAGVEDTLAGDKADSVRSEKRARREAYYKAANKAAKERQGKAQEELLAKWEQEGKDEDEQAGQAKVQRVRRFGGQVQAMTNAGVAALGGGATAKVGAAVQIGASGLLGSGAAAAAAGPIGIAAIGAAKAVDLLGQAARAGKEQLNAFADRGRELKGYNSQIASASAVADINKILADIREANEGADKFAAAIEANSKLDRALADAIKPLQRIGSDILTQMATFLTPVLKSLAKITEKAEDVYDVMKAAEANGGLEEGKPLNAEARKIFEGIKARKEARRERDNDAANQADLLDQFFRGLDEKIKPRNNPPLQMPVFGPMLRGGQ